MTTSLRRHAQALAQRIKKQIRSGDAFAKVLSKNDDSSRHGVVIPVDAYDFFPILALEDPRQNAAVTFEAFDAVRSSTVALSFIYYQRYPERRVTRIGAAINDRSQTRIVLLIRATHADGSDGYYLDYATSSQEARFANLFAIAFGRNAPLESGLFLKRQIDSGEFVPDKPLSELLGRFDEVRAKGWIKSQRAGSTGVGYTFESQIGIKENNDRLADFKGIEIKCKGVTEDASGSGGKLNLFQHGPAWIEKKPMATRIKELGAIDTADGRYRCHSQVTPSKNNLGLSLAVRQTEERIELRKWAEGIGFWTYEGLAKRLSEKHSRLLIVKARKRAKESFEEYSYVEAIYCERPTIGQFITLLERSNVVFEFIMSESATGRVRNHGYPWRLVREQLLGQLFSFQIQIR
jgi:hypothetical protein